MIATTIPAIAPAPIECDECEAGLRFVDDVEGLADDGVGLASVMAIIREDDPVGKRACEKEKLNFE